MGIGGIGAGLAGILCSWAVKTVKGAFPLTQSIRILCAASMALTVITSLLGFFFVNVQAQEVKRNQRCHKSFQGIPRSPKDAAILEAATGEYFSRVAVYGCLLYRDHGIAALSGGCWALWALCLLR